MRESEKENLWALSAQNIKKFSASTFISMYKKPFNASTSFDDESDEEESDHEIN